MIPEHNSQLQQAEVADLRDVTSTARLFNFRRPVFISAGVWDDCIDMQAKAGYAFDELTVLQRLRHVLFMAASALHGRIEDLELDFRVYRVPNNIDKGARQPEPVNLRLSAHRDEHHRPVIVIDFPLTQKG